MSLETELKLRVTSHEPTRQRLSDIGAALIERVTEQNVILDSTDGMLRRKGCGLRVRSVTDDDGSLLRTVLTFKGPRLPGPIKSREELETVVDCQDAILQILECLGFKPILQYEKRRESWSIGNCRVELDEPPHLGLFIEIEGLTEETIQAVRTRLGLDHAVDEKKSYVRMLLEHCKQTGKTPAIFTLDAERQS